MPLVSLHMIQRLSFLVMITIMLLTAAPSAHAATTTTTTSPPRSQPSAAAQEAGSGAGSGANGLSISIDTGSGGTAGEGSSAIQVLVVLTVLALAPSILIMTTGFTRILIVLGFMRNAIGTPTMPPNQVLVGLALFLTLFVMFPTFKAINDTALKPYEAKKITQQVALERAQKPMREFMFRQVHDTDLALFVRLAKIDRPKTQGDIPTYVLIPSFVISELKTAFQIGFLIFIPFLIIDMVVASVLMSMGMIMLPPVMISLPFKILLFVLVDGWSLIIESIVRGFGVAP